MPAKSYSEIDSIAEQMKAAGAPEADIGEYVQLAISELQAAQSPASNQKPAVASPTGPVEDQPRYTLKNLVSGLKALATDPRGLASAPARAVQNAKQVVTNPTMLRVGLPIAATIVSGGAGAPALATSLIGGGAAALGEGGAQLSEGGSVADLGAIGKAAVLGSLPGTKLIRGSGVGPAAARMLGEGGKFAALEALGETARQSINAGKLTVPYASVGDALQQTAVPGVIGLGFGGVGEGVRKLGAASAERSARLAGFKEAGIERPTLDLIFPTQAALVNRVASSNPAVAKLRLDATRPLLEQFQAMAESAPGNEAIYSRLRPYVGKIDSMRGEVATLEQQAAQMKQKADLAKSATQISPEMQAMFTQQATVAELNAVNAKARLLHEAHADLGGFMDYDAAAQQFGEVVDRLFKARKEIGAARFAASGVPANAPIFAKADLLASAKKGLERWRGTDLEKRILGAIEDAGGTDTSALTLGQFRELRGAFTDRFAGMDPRQLASAEAAGRAAYGSLTEASKQTIAKVPGANLDAYNAAVGYWRDTAEAASSRYARPLLAAEPSETTFQTLADDLASGRKAEVRAFNDFVASVAQDSPEVAQLASQRLTRAVRNSFLGQARTATGIDPKKLTDSLLRAQNQFEIGTLGFGSQTDIRRWADSMREFNLSNVGQADIDRMFADPQVQQAIGSGKSLGDALRPAVAKVAFEQRVQEQALQLALGKTAEASQKAQQAIKAAEVAGLTVAERKAALAAVEQDPIMQAFAGKQTWGIPDRPGDFGATDMNSISNTMLNLGPDDGLKLVSALRQKNPDLADQVQRRVLADVLQRTFRPANTPGDVWALNKAEVQRFFQPKAGSNEATRLATVKALVGPQQLRSMEKLLNAVQMVHDVERAGGILSTDGTKTIYAATGIGRDMANKLTGDNSTSLVMSGVRSVRDLWARGRYNVLANLATPGRFQEAFWQSGGALQPALDSMGPQKLFLLARDPALKRETDAEIEGGN